MHNGDRHSAHYGGETDAPLLKYGSSQGLALKLIGTSYNPCLWDGILSLLVQANILCVC